MPNPIFNELNASKSKAILTKHSSIYKDISLWLHKTNKSINMQVIFSSKTALTRIVCLLSVMVLSSNRISSWCWRRQNVIFCWVRMILRFLFLRDIAKNRLIKIMNRIYWWCRSANSSEKKLLSRLIPKNSKNWIDYSPPNPNNNAKYLNSEICIN